MTKSRRNFLKKSILGLSTIPSVALISKSEAFTSLKKIKQHLLNVNKNEFWSEVRDMFPTDKNDTYFNNGTLGVQSNYVLNKVISDMRNNACNGAKTD